MSTTKQALLSNDIPILIDSVYCLHRKGDHSSAETILKESQPLLESTPLYKALSCLVHLIGRYCQNSLNTHQFAELKNHQTEILSFDVPFYSGWTHFLHGYFLKNDTSLQKAADCFKEGDHLEEMCEVYYWMDKFNFLPVDEKIHAFVRLFPAKSIFSFLLGNCFLSHEILPQTEIEKQQAKHFEPVHDEFDCWVISKKSVIPAQYKRLSFDDQNFLDIYSGMINDRGEYTYLLISELNCLSFLIASQHTGASLDKLSAFLERPEEDCIALVASLKKMGIPIVQSQEKYFLDWPDKPITVIPRTLKVKGLYEFVKKKKKAFNKAQLIEMLQLTQFGAEALLRKWALAGIIKATEGPDKMVIWKFT